MPAMGGINPLIMSHQQLAQPVMMGSVAGPQAAVAAVPLAVVG
jgi:hypothetical protein